MGNTSEEAAALVRGRLQRGEASDGAFKRFNGTGYVPPKDGAYKRAQACGVDVSEWLVETFGGLGERLIGDLQAAGEYRSNKLTAAEYDETTWSARTWLSFVYQRLSVAVHKQGGGAGGAASAGLLRRRRPARDAGVRRPLSADLLFRVWGVFCLCVCLSVAGCPLRGRPLWRGALGALGGVALPLQFLFYIRGGQTVCRN